MACAIGGAVRPDPGADAGGGGLLCADEDADECPPPGGPDHPDDGYNANPQSMKAALEILSPDRGNLPGRRPGGHVRTGGIGPGTPPEHGEWGRFLGNIDGLLAVGDPAWNIYDAARENGMEGVFYAKDRATAKALLPNFIRPDGVILVKASRGWPLRRSPGRSSGWGPRTEGDPFSLGCCGDKEKRDPEGSPIRCSHGTTQNEALFRLQAEKGRPTCFLARACRPPSGPQPSP